VRASTFVAIDFETADYQRDSACAIGLVRVERSKLVQSVARLIRPPRRQFVFTYIHGITWNRVKDEPTFAEVWRDVQPMLDGAAFIAAHNVSFDRSVLQACCERALLEPPVLRWICSMKAGRRVWGPPASLDSLCRRVGIALNHHDALSDAEACARLLLAAEGTAEERSTVRPRGTR
jgi:DNA polymerase-3 subunit epsilon